jgi:predicted Ser/Thr protein kinase/outer membrane protein assembly factor BamB
VKPLADTDPTTIGAYRLLGVLGNGGMGRVYMGQSRSGRPVAIKVIRPDLVDDPVFRRRFAREVAAVREVNPLFTAAVVDSDLSAEAPWLATTYIEGPSLERWVEGHGALSSGAVLTLAAGLAEALASIHAAGLVHRDLKPSNVLLGDVGPYIIDFGVVLSPKATRLTSSLVVGTPSYLAPERIHGGEATPATDMFSLGATMYYAATARTLVDDSDTVYAQMMHIVKARFDLGRVPSELRPMIMRCLSADPRDRPTAAELSGILAAAGVSAPEPGWHQAISDVPFSAVLTPRRIRRTSRRRLVLAGGLVGLATAGGVAAGLIGRYVRDDDAPKRPDGGTLLWQGRSGAEPVPVVYGAPPGSPAPAASGSPGQGSGRGGGRPDPTALWLVPLGDKVMAAGTRTEVRAGGPDQNRWSRQVPNGLVALHRWGGSLLVAGGELLVRLNAATGDEEFRTRSGPPRRVVVSPTLAFVGAGGSAVAPPGTAETGPTSAPATGAYLAAFRTDGTIAWRRPGGGTPLYADDRWVLTHDRLGDRVRIALHEAATGNPRWNVEFPAPPVVDETSQAAAGPPPPPPGGRPDGPGRPGSGRPGPPPYSHAWNYTQAVIVGDFVVVRDASEFRSLRLADGSQAWTDRSPLPVTDLAPAGDLVLTAADRIRARRPDDGTQQWQVDSPGSRMAVAPGRAVVLAGPDGRVSAHDLAGGELWQTDLPADAQSGIPDRLVVDGDQVIITMAPPPGAGPRPGTVDVVALAL